MSMIMNFFAFSPADFKRIEADEEAAAELLGTADCIDVDYRTIAAAVEAMAEAEGEDETDPDFAEEGELSYEGTYGPAMYWSPKSFEALEESSGWAMAVELEPALGKLLAKAKKNKLTLVAVVD